MRAGQTSSRLSLIHPNGRIVQYRNCDMEAVCKCLGHVTTCKVSRASHSPKGVRKVTHPFQGRPFAGLYAWLDAGHTYDQPGTLGKAPSDHKAYVPDLAARRRKRVALKALAQVHGPESVLQKFLNAERKKKDTESDSEPSGGW